MRTNVQPYPTTRGAMPKHPESGYYGLDRRIQLFAYAYYRLSREEAQKSESTSISNQKKIVEAYCQQHGINMTCVADGTLLHFLTTGEICTIVGTALDNATESVLTEQDPEKRLIRVAIYAQNGFVMLRFENYCTKPVELAPDGLPRRSSHGGYDLKSVRAAAEAHGGTLTLHWENEWFTLRVLLPQK